MRALKIAEVLNQTVTQETLELAPARLIAFADCLGTDREISTLMMARGWSDARMEEVWALIDAWRRTNKPARALPLTGSVSQSVALCEAFQANGLVCVRAFLEATYPEQAVFIFHDFVAGEGAVAVYNVSAFVERYQELATSPARKATRKADHEALDLIALSGTTKETVKTLERAVHEVKTTTAHGRTADEVAADQASDEQRVVVLRKIYACITMWTQVARTVVKRRDQQIKLGIARRKAPRKAAATTPDPAAPPAIPPTASTSEEQSPPSRAA